jgi:hypothetical protein
VGVDDPTPLDPRVRAEARRGLDELIDGLSNIGAAIRRHAARIRRSGTASAGRTPAQLVDAVVQTAADGIEDLAAGSCARTSSRAWPSASPTGDPPRAECGARGDPLGSEAFASIAEETRRLAEFAREATDTISRLSSEIEYKVGETITAIHATSEDAKSAVLLLAGSPALPAPPPAPAVSIAEVEALLERARKHPRHAGQPRRRRAFRDRDRDHERRSDRGREPARREDGRKFARTNPGSRVSPRRSPSPVPVDDKGTTNPHIMMLEGVEPRLPSLED